jgi:hypothetical protein
MPAAGRFFPLDAMPIIVLLIALLPPMSAWATALLALSDALGGAQAALLPASERAQLALLCEYSEQLEQVKPPSSSYHTRHGHGTRKRATVQLTCRTASPTDPPAHAHPRASPAPLPPFSPPCC